MTNVIEFPSDLVVKRLVTSDRNARTERFGPEPTNPFYDLRTQLGLNLVELSKQALIDRKALSRSEKGMYALPLPSLVDFWVNRGVVTEGELVSDYEIYQLEQRKRHRFYFGPALNVDVSLPLHPFRQLRSQRPHMATFNPFPVGITECCESLCLSLDTTQFFEKKFRTQKSVPKNIKLCLNQIGYTSNQIDHFSADYAAWRDMNKMVIFNG